MKIIKPSVEIVQEPDNLKRIELAARVCYKSEDRIGSGTAEKMCRMLIERGHTAMLEHSNVIIHATEEGSLWELISETPGLHERTTGKPSMIRWSFDRDGGYILSGNVRAWRELVRSSRGDICFRDDPLFSDLPAGRVDLSKWTIGPSELRASERDRHSIITARFVCAEGVSLEMFRHRIAAADYEVLDEAPAVCLSPAQESTRYVDYGGGDIQFVEPWWWNENRDKLEWARLYFEGMCKLSEQAYKSIRTGECALPPQAARAVLTKAVKTEIVLTQTPERWREWLALREAQPAHPDMRICARMFREAAEGCGLM